MAESVGLKREDEIGFEREDGTGFFRRYAHIERSDTVLTMKCIPKKTEVLPEEPNLREAVALVWRAANRFLGKNTRAMRSFLHYLCHDLWFVWLFASFGWGTLITLIAMMALLK